MLTKGSRAGGVGIKPGLRTVMLHGHPPEASSEGVPLFLQREGQKWGKKEKTQLLSTLCKSRTMGPIQMDQ